MIDRAYVQRMARYNRWQNENLYGVADRLSAEERGRERGAFFGSIHKTLSHLLWGDQIWMSRFTDVPKPQAGIPESVSLYPDWDDLKSERAKFRPDHYRLGRCDRTVMACRRTNLLFRRDQARVDQAALDARHAYVQSPDPSSRSGPLHADASGRQAARYRSAGHAGMNATKAD